MGYSDSYKIEQLTEKVRDMAQKLQEQDEFLRRITSLPTTLGVVLIAHPTTPLVMIKDEITEMSTMVPVQTGDVVRISTPTMDTPVATILNVSSYSMPGDITTFKKDLGDMMEVLKGGTVAVVFKGKVSTAQEGDRIVLDSHGLVALQNLGAEEETFTFDHVDVGWDKIGGQEEAKQVLREAIELPVLYGNLFAEYNKVPLKGVILSGPPGNGKTLLGKAAATAANKVYGGHGPNPFMYIKGGELLSMYVGAAEANIRGVFQRAHKYIDKYKSPLVMFFDEAEALFPTRGSGISSDVANTIVPAMLSEMDGFNKPGAFVMMATNRLDMVDPAIIRDGRLNRILTVEPPDKTTALDIFKIHMDNKPLKKRLTVDRLAEYGALELFSDARKLPNARPLSSVISGAMIEGVTNRSVSIAIHRDIALGNTSASGICFEDMLTAIEQVHAEQTRLIRR